VGEWLRWFGFSQEVFEMSVPISMEWVFVTVLTHLRT